jgi:tetratricopeptide (TPR) repeat protein
MKTSTTGRIDPRGRQPRRNEPCPCGSGRKYKHCCGAVAVASDTASQAWHVGGEFAAVLPAGGAPSDAVVALHGQGLRNAADPAVPNNIGLAHLRANRLSEAIRFFQQAIALRPGYAIAHYNLGCALELQQRVTEAIAAFRRAIAVGPGLAEAHEKLGDLLLWQGQWAAALDCFRRVAALAPERSIGRLNKAKVHNEEDRHAEAEATLRKAIALNPAGSELHRLLGSVLAKLGRFDEAIACFQRSIDADPSQIHAYSLLVNARKITDADRPLLERIGKVLQRTDLTERQHGILHFALGKAFDDLHCYTDAIRHFDAGNQAMRSGVVFDRAHFAASVDRMIASFTAASFADTAAEGSDDETPVLIVGMPRSGTTLVEQIVSNHPRVAAGGELLFWPDSAAALAQAKGGLTTSVIGKLAEHYRAVLRRISPDAARVTDKLPHNFMWLGLVHLVMPRARIIHCRRHPVDTCLSIYFTGFDRLMEYAWDRGDIAFYYRQYARLMQHWRSALPADRLLDVDYEELTGDAGKVTRRLIEFLGLDWNDACLRPEANRRAVTTASVWQARQPVYGSSVARWRNYEPWLGELRQLLPGAATTADAVPPQAAAAAGHKLRAHRLREAGRLAEAASVLREAIALTPDDAAIFNELAFIYLLQGRVSDALEGFERAVALKPDLAVAHYHRGVALERLRRYAEAIAAHRQAVRHDPHLTAAHARVGNLLHNQGDRQAAIESFRRAAEAAPDTALGLVCQAKVLLIEQRAPAAEACLRRALALDGGNAEVQQMLGGVLREAGRFDEAIGFLNRAIELDAERVSAYLELVNSQRITDAQRPLVARMQAVLEQPGRNDFERSVLHFALGKAFDDLSDYGSAIRHFDVGNALEHSGRPFDRSAFAARIDRMVATFTRDALAARHRTASDSAVPIVIVGMPRSGTTLVEQIVTNHPDAGVGGELTFWDEQAVAHGLLAAGSPTEAQTGALAESYLAQWRDLAPDAARVTDKNPFNFLWAGLIHLVFPNATIIHCRRDPIDICLSVYFTRFATRQDFAYDRDDLVFYYRQYRRLMAHWRSVLPRERFVEIDYEELVADRARATQRLIAACGLSWNDACLKPERNPRPVRTASLWQARQPVYASSVARWRHYQPWLGALGELAPDHAATTPATVTPAPSVEELVQRASRLAEDDDLEQAITVLEQAIALRPDDPVLLTDLALAYISCGQPQQAVERLQRAIELKPDFAIAQHNLGIALELQGRDAEAVVAYRGAIFHDPKLIEAHERLGNLLLAHGDVDAAVGCFSRAAAAAPDTARGWQNQARVLLRQDHAAAAEDCLRRALELDPASSEAYRILGRVLQELGRFDEAIAAFDRAVELNPEQVSALVGTVLSKRLTAADRPLIDRMLAELNGATRSGHERTSLHFGLGKAFDDLGAYADAIAHFDAANAIKSRNNPFDRGRCADQVQRLIDRNTGEFFRSRMQLGTPSETPVLILGMPRSGTTLVEQIVSSHRMVGGGGELTFWQGCAAALERAGPGGLTPAFARGAAREYLTVLRQCAPDALRVTDKNPFNFLHVGLIHLIFPKAFIVHCRRNPVDACLSNYFTDLARLDYPSTKGDLVFYYRQYVRLMAHWRAVLPPERFLEVDYEALIGDREQVTRGLIGFCGLDWDEACLRPERNRREVRTASLWQARQPVYATSVARWRHYEPWLGELRELLVTES